MGIIEHVAKESSSVQHHGHLYEVAWLFPSSSLILSVSLFLAPGAAVSFSFTAAAAGSSSSFPMTFSNVLQSASTDENSLPTVMTDSRLRFSLLMLARTSSKLWVVAGATDESAVYIYIYMRKY